MHSVASRRRGKLLGSVLIAVVALLSTVVLVPTATAAEPERTVVVTSGGKTVTARLHPVTLRSPGFEVLLQQADGTMAAQTVGPERTWLGSVDGDPAARVSGIVRSDGAFEGAVVFDRGETWRFRDGTVYDVRGATAPTTYKWPTDPDSTRMLSTSPGQAGTTTYRFDLGFDLANDWFTHSSTINSSVAKALDAVEYTTAMMLGRSPPRPLTGRNTSYAMLQARLPLASHCFGSIRTWRPLRRARGHPRSP